MHVTHQIACIIMFSFFAKIVLIEHGMPIICDTVACLAETESDGPSLGKQMIYSYLLSGGSSYDKYDRFLRRLGMPPFSEPQFHKAMKDVMVAVLEQLDDEIAATKEWLKENDLWYVGLMGLDGSWCTPGSSAPHGLFAARALKAFGALLGFKFFSRNDPAEPFMATSAAMELLGCICVLRKLFGEGFGRELLKAICDGDTSAGKLIVELWTNFLLLACSGHMNKNLGQCVDVNAKKKGGVKGITSKCCCKDCNHRFTGKSRRSKVVATAGIDGTQIPDEEFVRSLKVCTVV